MFALDKRYLNFIFLFQTMLVPSKESVNSEILQGIFFTPAQYLMSHVEQIVNVKMVLVEKIAPWILFNQFIEIH